MKGTWGDILDAFENCYLQCWAVDHPNETLPNEVVAAAKAYALRMLGKLMENEPVE